MVSVATAFTAFSLFSHPKLTSCFLYYILEGFNPSFFPFLLPNVQLVFPIISSLPNKFTPLQSKTHDFWGHSADHIHPNSDSNVSLKHLSLLTED